MLATGIIPWLEKLPPQFGHAMLEYYPFDSEYLNLNHGESRVGSFSTTFLPHRSFQILTVALKLLWLPATSGHGCL
jgi:hypothetical protein